MKGIETDPATRRPGKEYDLRALCQLAALKPRRGQNREVRPGMGAESWPAYGRGSGPAEETPHNRMELAAVIEALRDINQDATITLENQGGETLQIRSGTGISTVRLSRPLQARGHHLRVDSDEVAQNDYQTSSDAGTPALRSPRSDTEPLYNVARASMPTTAAICASRQESQMNARIPRWSAVRCRPTS